MTKEIERNTLLEDRKEAQSPLVKCRHCGSLSPLKFSIFNIEMGGDCECCGVDIEHEIEARCGQCERVIFYKKGYGE